MAKYKRSSMDATRAIRKGSRRYCLRQSEVREVVILLDNFQQINYGGNVTIGLRFHFYNLAIFAPKSEVHLLSRVNGHHRGCGGFLY